MTDEYPPIVPYIFYGDGLAAMEWLDKTFGFRERMRTVDDAGALRHGEMQLGDAVVMLAAPPDYRNPKELGGVTVGMYVHVDDVDAIYERAVAAGAAVEGPPVDQPYGERLFGVIDPEGHQWWIAKAIA
jgi:PhnB protein